MLTYDTAVRRGASLQPLLATHLRAWLGAWPPARPVHLVGSPWRERPGWDGAVRPVVGVGDGTALVLSVPPDVARRLRSADVGGRCPTWLLAEALGADPAAAAQVSWSRAVFRWTTRPAALPSIGTWVPGDDPALPAWLLPFPGPILVAFDEAGEVAAAAARKVHTRHGHEISVGTEPAARGRGLARALVAQMARRILADGAVPLYLHDPENTASARVAEAAGFPDRGWEQLELTGLPAA